jgi:hypothetical protein
MLPMPELTVCPTIIGGKRLERRPGFEPGLRDRAMSGRPSNYGHNPGWRGDDEEQSGRTTDEVRPAFRSRQEERQTGQGSLFASFRRV